MIEGLSLITLIVSDLNRTTEFLTGIFDAEQVYDSGDYIHPLSRERFFLIGGVCIAIIEGDPLPTRKYNHVAFTIPDSEFAEYERRIKSLDLDVRASRPRIDGEGRSLYRCNNDNYSFKLHARSLALQLQC